MFNRISEDFHQLFMRNRIAPYVIVLAAVEAFVLLYYSLFEPTRLYFELLISGAITIGIGFPAIWYAMGQHHKLEAMSFELAAMAEIDQMTGLLNRQTFIRKLAATFANGADSDSAGAFAYIDADRFKSINDRFGHEAGDRVIETIADSLRASVRRGDLIARLGGEEFGVFLYGATAPQAALVAERLRAELRQRGSQIGIPRLSVSVSIGIARHQPGADAQSVMREADRSLYAAKRAGRNSVVIDLKRFRAA